MKKFYILSILVIFLTSCATTTVTPTGSDFWDFHGWFQLLGWIMFPRLMFWFFSVITGGFWFWVGVFFTPHIMAAFWFTTYYWHTNPILCVFAWIYALTREKTEKSTATNTYKKYK